MFEVYHIHRYLIIAKKLLLGRRKGRRSEETLHQLLRWHCADSTQVVVAEKYQLEKKNTWHIEGLFSHSSFSPSCLVAIFS
ncbi:hypothetical protein LZ554_002090 [Drepanopeziza brunnea f. sp. 'monogermtubi']|nr:hypothetical protein LZ554_002090 [Drepanopeziza brunnea f. sp. 'monogermtubi']